MIVALRACEARRAPSRVNGISSLLLKRRLKLLRSRSLLLLLPSMNNILLLACQCLSTALDWNPWDVPAALSGIHPYLLNTGSLCFTGGGTSSRRPSGPFPFLPSLIDRPSFFLLFSDVLSPPLICFKLLPSFSPFFSFFFFFFFSFFHRIIIIRDKRVFVNHPGFIYITRDFTATGE